MTWPMEQAFPGVNPVSSPTVSNVTSQSEMAQNWTPSCEMLLTAQDVREGEAFIAEMELKRQVSVSKPFHQIVCIVCNFLLHCSNPVNKTGLISGALFCFDS